MGYKNILFFFLAFLSLHETVQGEAAAGIFEDIIENIRPALREVSMPHLEFDTKKQEFGRITGILDNVVVTELDRFEVLKLDATVIPLGLKNLTLKFPTFVVRGKYDIDGTLIFPIGNEPLHLFGNGGMTIKFGDSYAFTKMMIGLKGGLKVVKELDLGFNITTMNVKMENLMGGGLLEDIFNDYFSKIGPTIYDYYKATLLEELKKPMADAITKLLNEMI